MEYDVVVGRIGVVTVTLPVRRTQVQLNIAHPHRTAYAHLGVEEVRAGICVMQTGVYNLNLLTVGREQASGRP